jgi:3-hydroxyisobutyrate dehydrogenase
MSSRRDESIAFIGLGQMGQPMARRLVKAGYSVRAFDLSSRAREAFCAAGGRAVSSTREACAEASIIITILPNGKIVHDALLADQAVASASPKALVIEMSSSAPLQTRKLEGALSRFGIGIIDAPVSGGVKRATDGTLAIMVGGDSSNVERAHPILRTFGQSVLTIGALGAGHAMKALNNYVSAAGLVAVCEAVVVGQSFGMDPQVIVDVLNVSSGRNNSTDTKMKPFVLSGSFASGFSMALMAKDLNTAAELSRDVNANAEGILSAARLWTEASRSMASGADHTAIFQYLSGLAHEPKAGGSADKEATVGLGN